MCQNARDMNARTGLLIAVITVAQVDCCSSTRAKQSDDRSKFTTAAPAAAYTDSPHSSHRRCGRDPAL
ncbi:hypothetical protein LIA77_00056 [Sarocladium implicatum]|nr:hypothetical protein LIA77_00056 [Sarocladium implicatum]